MKTRAFIYIILAGVLWGTTGLFVNFLAPFGFSSMQLTALRASVAFICIAAFAVIKNRSLFKASARQLLIYAAMGVSICATAIFYFISLQRTSIASAVTLMYSAPIYVMLFSVIFFGERLSALKLTSVAFMLAGCALVSGVVGEPASGFDTFGVLMGVLSGIAFAAYNVITKISARQNCNSVSATLYGFMFMAISAIAVSKPWEIPSIMADNVSITLPLCIALGVVTCALPYLFYTLAMKNISASTASALGTIEPMSATLFGFFVLGEELTVFSVMGILLILSAVIMLGKNEKN